MKSWILFILDSGLWKSDVLGHICAEIQDTNFKAPLQTPKWTDTITQVSRSAPTTEL